MNYSTAVTERPASILSEGSDRGSLRFVRSNLIRYTGRADPLLHNKHRWEYLAPRYQSTFPLETLDLYRHVRPHHRVLDYGCGEGRGIKMLLRMGANQPNGCDVSATMCSLARRGNPTAGDILVCEPRGCPFPTESFDTVLVVGVLSSVIGADEREAFIRRTARLLRKNGALLIADFGRSSDAPYPERYASAQIEPRTFRTTDDLLIHHFEAPELGMLLGQQLSVTHVRTVDVKTSHGNYLPGHVIWATKC